MEVLTPLRRQYLEVKRRYPHAIVFFRLGDFYETFDDDAKLVARELEITLTSRPLAKGVRVPLAGVPHHALDSYLARLISKGYKVAICEQMEPPAKGKRLLSRQVVRVVTPGTVVEDNLLEQRANNYLAALIEEEGSLGLAYVDVSTGEFACTQVGGEALLAELDRLRPAELLLPAGQEPPAGLQASVTSLEAPAFDLEAAEQRLREHFGASTLVGLGLEGLTLAVRAAGAALHYLSENQRAVLPHLYRLSTYTPTSFMVLDAETRRNLELFQPLRPSPGSSSLLDVIDLTKTALGGRLLRRWLGQPLRDIRSISRRLDCTQLFFDSALRRGQVAALLAKMPDLERLLGRISAGLANPRDLVALRRGLELIPELRRAIDLDPASAGGKRGVHEELLAACQPCPDAGALIAAALADEPGPSFEEGGIIRPGFSPELDSLRALASDVRQFLADLERRQRARTGIKSLKVGYNKVFGYYLEVSKANLGLVPSDYQRQQTLVGGERFTTPELKDYEFRILQAREQQQELERSLYRQVCAQVAAHGPAILKAAAAVAEIDVFCALAEAAVRYGYTRPQVDDGDTIDIRDGRHPVVERMLPASASGGYVPNDASLSNGEAQVIVLTGPNMAGKSTYLRQVALIVLLAQIGSFVPAAQARIGVVDRIFTRVGALDEIAAGRSTFMVEMLETAAILHNATPRSLLLFDEIGRGTSTYDGMAIARAVIEFIHNSERVGAKTLFATHYHELVDLAAFLPRVRNFNVAVAEEGGRIVFLHRIIPGGADRSYGVHVAQLAGLPRPVVQRAQELLQELEAARDRHDQRRARPRRDLQLPLFTPQAQLARELAALDVDSLTPLQALTKLYELAEKARENQY